MADSDFTLSSTSMLSLVMKIDTLSLVWRLVSYIHSSDRVLERFRNNLCSTPATLEIIQASNSSTGCILPLEYGGYCANLDANTDLDLIFKSEK